ncbi:MAG: Hsp20/alpha crystallin family protein [Candidatus Zipacnadales bacterium]
MATRYAYWSIEMASPPLGRRRNLLRLSASERQILIPARMAFEPPTDVYETEHAVIVRLEIPGLQENCRAVMVEIRDDLLTVAGERPDPAAGSHRRYTQMEIQTGAFQRQVRLPCPVDETDASAKYEDGFLVVQLSKRVHPPTHSRIVEIE